MGLFASRPQEPFSWAGLPAQPHRDHTDAEFLEDPPVDPFAITSDVHADSISIVVDGQAPAGDEDPAEPGGDTD